MMKMKIMAMGEAAKNTLPNSYDCGGEAPTWGG